MSAFDHNANLALSALSLLTVATGHAAAGSTMAVAKPSIDFGRYPAHEARINAIRDYNAMVVR